MGKYIDVNELGPTLNWKEGMSGNNDERLDSLIPVCEERIDNICGRTFDLANSASRRWYEVVYASLEDGIDIDDAPHEHITEVVMRSTHPDSTDGTNRTLNQNQWRVSPLSRTRNGREWPADQVHLVRQGINEFKWSYDRDFGFSPRGYGEYPFTSFPGTGSNSVGYVGVTARWGWPRVPAPIKEATILMVNRLGARLASPLGTEGSDAYGFSYIRKTDPDIADLLSPYIKRRLL